MTEIYHGPWSPLTGDRPQVKVPNDSYHPRYAEVQVSRVRSVPVQEEQKTAPAK